MNTWELSGIIESRLVLGVPRVGSELVTVFKAEILLPFLSWIVFFLGSQDLGDANDEGQICCGCRSNLRGFQRGWEWVFIFKELPTKLAANMACPR